MNTMDATMPDIEPSSRPYFSGENVNNPTITSHILLMSKDMVAPLPELDTYFGVVSITEK